MKLTSKLLTEVNSWEVNIKSKVKWTWYHLKEHTQHPDFFLAKGLMDEFARIYYNCFIFFIVTIKTSFFLRTNPHSVIFLIWTWYLGKLYFSWQLPTISSARQFSIHELSLDPASGNLRKCEGLINNAGSPLAILGT